jgi:hypothetical protein
MERRMNDIDLLNQQLLEQLLASDAHVPQTTTTVP